MADRRNSELHSGAAAFENIDNSSWLPATYEVVEVLLKHVGVGFEDFLGEEQADVAIKMLKDRREHIKKEVLDRISKAKKAFTALSIEQRAQREAIAKTRVAKWLSQKSSQAELSMSGMRIFGGHVRRIARPWSRSDR